MATARGVVIKAQLQGLREVKARFADAVRVVGGAGSQRASGPAKLIQDAYSAAARFVRDKARSRAQSGGAPKRLYAGAKPAIFAFSDFSAAGRRGRSALIGVRTGLSSKAPDPSLYVRWGRGAKRRKDGSTATGGLSMSFGALFERGTQDRRIRPIRYFRSAIFTTRSQVIRLLTDAYRSAADVLNRK